MISIIIPMHNASGYIGACLRHISRLKGSHEVIVVDDCSSDNSFAIANEAGYVPIRACSSGGPSTARNLGVDKARGDVLFFVDSDVYLRPDILDCLTSRLKAYPDMAGVSFIYSLDHPNKNFVSLYKNFSIRAEEMAKPDFGSSFRFSAFAMRREAFDSIGNFDSAPCCEELEFSLKTKEHNLIFYLDKKISVVHAKSYTFMELVKSDFIRAYNYFKIFWKDYQRIVKNYPDTKQMMIRVLISQVQFLKSAYKVYGPMFAFKAFIFRVLEMVIGGAAMIAALINFFLSGIRKRLF